MFCLVNFGSLNKCREKIYKNKQKVEDEEKIYKNKEEFENKQDIFKFEIKKEYRNKKNFKKSEENLVTEKDLEMIAYVIAKEVEYMDYHYKKTIAEIIKNRLFSDKFPDNVYDVLHQRKQFGSIKNYYSRKIKPSKDTYLAVREVFAQKSNITNGAIYYRNVELSNRKTDRWFNSLEVVYVYSYNCYGKVYTTQYYK